MRLRVSKRELQKHLDELTSLAKTVTTDVEAEVLIPGDEGQHAWLKLYVPDEFADEIDDLLTERSTDIFHETGYDIAAIAFEKSQYRRNAVEAE